jgi:hypothetical protein
MRKWATKTFYHPDAGKNSLLAVTGLQYTFAAQEGHVISKIHI